jgi:basic amino acid/polyamine antiporter, APA family
MQPPPRSSQLIRVIGRWSMVALVINCILGSGIFGLPSAVARLLGGVSPVAVLLAGAAMGVIIACYAEVASQFTDSGGTYLYLRRAFGVFAGVQVGWLMLLVRLTACAASVNLLVAYLGEFWPAATHATPRLIVITVFVAALLAVNYRGVSGGTALSNTVAVAKLAALALVGALGLAWLGLHPQPLQHSTPTAAGWLQAILLLFFAYGGYEAALNPQGEARNPQRDVAFALFVALLVVTALYATLQLIVVAVLADPGRSERPLADAARVFMGEPGAAFIALAALVSVCGYVNAMLLTAPRGMYALAERGDFPHAFAAVHPRFRTPHVSIAVFALLVWLFSLFASFSWNVTLSAVARLTYYAGICAAVPVLRRAQPGAATFRVPGGLAFPVLGVLICALLLTRVDFSKSLVLLLTVLIGCVNWALVRERGAARAARSFRA